MKQFFEQYGAVALGILALLVLIAMITPVGNIIKTSLQGTSNKFATSMNGQLDTAMEGTAAAQEDAMKGEFRYRVLVEYGNVGSIDANGDYRVSSNLRDNEITRTDITTGPMPALNANTTYYLISETYRGSGNIKETYYIATGTFAGKKTSETLYAPDNHTKLNRSTTTYNTGYGFNNYVKSTHYKDYENNDYTKDVTWYEDGKYEIKTYSNFTGNKEVKLSEAFYDNSGNMTKQYLYSYYEDGTTRKTKIKDNPADGYFTHEYLEEYDRSGNFRKTFYNPDGSVNEIKCYNSSNASIACSAVNL